MKETEITVEILEPLNEAVNKIIKSGYTIDHKFIMKDCYFSKHSTEILKNFKYEDLIKNSFLLRTFVEFGETTNFLIYKSKNYDNNGNVISEEKCSTPIQDTSKVKKVLELAGINCWCEIEQNMTVFTKDNADFVLQEIEGLGNYIEYEEQPYMKDWTEEEKINELLNTLKNIGLNLSEDYSCKKILKIQTTM